MDNNYRLNHKKYQTILINHFDRLLDFYITLYAARTEDAELKDALLDTRGILMSDLMDKGLSLDEIKKYNIEGEALDIFQANFSYGRNLQNIPKENASQEEKEKYKQVSTAIYELSTGNNVFMQENGECVIEKENGGSPNYKDAFSVLKTIFPCLHQILASDILRSPSLEDFIPLINDAIKSNIKVQVEEKVDDAAMAEMIKLTEFYPERLFLGLRYVFPETKESLPHCELGFSMHHLTPDDEVKYALRDIHYQHNKFKAYYHHQECPSQTELQLDRVMSLSSFPSRTNKYIKQLNSIENSFLAMRVWKMIHLNEMTQADAIDTVLKYESQRRGNVSTDQEAGIKKGMRDKLPNIERFIKAKRKHQDILRGKYELMHPEFHSNEIIKQFT